MKEKTAEEIEWKISEERKLIAFLSGDVGQLYTSLPFVGGNPLPSKLKLIEDTGKYFRSKYGIELKYPKKNINEDTLPSNEKGKVERVAKKILSDYREQEIFAQEQILKLIKEEEELVKKEQKAIEDKRKKDKLDKQERCRQVLQRVKQIKEREEELAKKAIEDKRKRDELIKKAIEDRRKREELAMQEKRKRILQRTKQMKERNYNYEFISL